MRCVLAILLALAMPWRAQAAEPAAELWAHFERFDPSSTRVIEHEPWRKFLAAYVRTEPAGRTLVAYREISSADRRSLQAYIDGLAALPILEFRRDEQLAYWINLYNALTVRVVLDHYPTASPRNIGISPGLFSIGPRGAKLLHVAGEQVSLDDIEHRILRPIWRDSRLHYALNRGTRGCPDLQPEPFTALQAEKQLDAAALKFINSSRAVWIEDSMLYTSTIYRWFEPDFGGDDRGVIRHLMAYAQPDLAMRLQFYRRITGDAYDWTLNDAAR